MKKYVQIEILNPFKALGVFLAFVSVIVFIAFFFNDFIKGNKAISFVLIVLNILALFLSSFLIKRFLVKKITLFLGNESIIIKDKNETLIEFNSIKKYYIEQIHGAKIKLWVDNERKVILQSNHYFCNTALDNFALDLRDSIEKWRIENNKSIKRIKSFFEYKIVFIFLILVTIFICSSFVYIIVIGKNLPNSIFGAIASISIMWASYFSFKRRN